ncbi:expressed unknown protein [Seminavis robusta]|uniref:Uncharacterized protein n=1 Tax=Seminavis robusta TaxID=568900 RepID=A0A9N8EYQ2_9STRA|nr:expressed unknown protein [Seminavis robusta]|eukprot:Sro2125_g315690.1 n/a (525) ;mRNA; r:14672-16246
MDVLEAATVALTTQNMDNDQSSQMDAYKGELSHQLDPFRLFIRNYSADFQHEGRFTIPCSDNTGTAASNDETDPPSLQSSALFAMDDPLEFLQSALSWSSTQTAQHCHGKSNEVVVFLPALSMSHRQAQQQLQYCSNVLDGIPMALLFPGTFSNYHNNNQNPNGDDTIIAIQLTHDTLQSLQSFHLISMEPQQQQAKNKKSSQESTTTTMKTYRVRSKDLDCIRAVLSLYDSSTQTPFATSHDDALKTTLIKLIDVAVTKQQSSSSSSSPHLVLVTCSATCTILASALLAWRRQQTLAHAESLLHQAITVVTMNGLLLPEDQSFCNGPAYVHVSMQDDPIVAQYGVTSNSKNTGGRNAVHLQALSPYHQAPQEQNLGSNPELVVGNAIDDDIHNIATGAIQYLSLLLRINGVQSFRQLYQQGAVSLANNDEEKQDIDPKLFALNYDTKVGTIEIPPLMDLELLPAMIRATGGDRWRTAVSTDDADEDDDILPDWAMAEAIITDQFGYGVYDEIVELCSSCRAVG